MFRKLILTLITFFVVSIFLFFPREIFAQACSVNGRSGTCQYLYPGNCANDWLGQANCSTGDSCCADSALPDVQCANQTETCYSGSTCPTAWTSGGSCTKQGQAGVCCSPPSTIETCNVGGISGNCLDPLYGCSTYWLDGGSCQGSKRCCSSSPRQDVACSNNSACYTSGSCPTGKEPLGENCITNGASGICCKEAVGSPNNPYSQAPSPTPICEEGSIAGGTCKVLSAIGSIPTTASGFISFLLGIILSFSGAIALILIIRSGYQLMASQGNPEQIQAAKEQLTAAIVGILFIIFSLVFLEVIGVDILKLPGFN